MKSIISVLLLLITINCYSQQENYIDKQYIFIGEGNHYYKYNKQIELNLIQKIIEKSKYSKIVIGLEAAPALEYFINTKDTNKLITYLKYNTDRYFSDTSLTKLNMYKKSLYIKILEYIKNDNRISVKCFDVNSNIRPILYTINYIFNNNPNSILKRKFYNDINNYLKKKDFILKDTLIFYSIKKELHNIHEMEKKNINCFDFYYLNKILETPINRIIIGNKRENFIFKQLNNKKENEQLICIIGSYHIIKSQKNNMRNKFDKKNNSIFNKKTYYIGLIPEIIKKKYNYKKEFDMYITFKNNSILFDNKNLQ